MHSHREELLRMVKSSEIVRPTEQMRGGERVPHYFALALRR